MLVLKDLVGLHRTIQLQLLQHYWSRHRLELLWYWMVCLGNEQRSFCRFWDCIQVLHFGLFCWLWLLLHSSKRFLPTVVDIIITLTTALSNSVKLSHAMYGYPRQMGHGREFWQNVVYWRRERRRQWQATPVLLPRKSHGWRSMVGYSPWGRYESDTTEQLHFHTMEKAVATHSSVLAWRLPGTAEPGWLPSMVSHRVGHDWSDLAAAVAGGGNDKPLQYSCLENPMNITWRTMPFLSVILSDLVILIK